MRDFIRGEWKRILVILLVTGGMWYFFAADTQIERQESKLEVTVDPGRSVLDLQLGITTDEVLSQLGKPERTEPMSLGGEIWHYPSSQRRLYIVDGRLRTIGIDLVVDGSPTDFDPIGPEGRSLRHWGGKPPIQSRKLESFSVQSKKFLRFPGLVVEFSESGGKAVALYVVGEQLNLPEQR